MPFLSVNNKTLGTVVFSFINVSWFPSVISIELAFKNLEAFAITFLNYNYSLSVISTTGKGTG